jgi:hypothetical protein
MLPTSHQKINYDPIFGLDKEYLATMGHGFFQAAVTVVRTVYEIKVSVGFPVVECGVGHAIDIPGFQENGLVLPVNYDSVMSASATKVAAPILA